MLKEFLYKNWQKLTHADVPRSLQAVPVSSCLEDYGNDIVLVFVDEATFPEYVLKASRNPAYGFKIENEFNSLKAFSGSKLSSYVPFPYYLGDYNGNRFLLQGGFAGVALSRLILQKGVNEKIELIINQSIDLLVEIGKTRQIKETSVKNINCETDRAYEHIENELTSQKHKNKIRELREYNRALEKEGNTFYLHGDYWQTNIIVDYKKAQVKGIIDWEFSRHGGAYPRDIISFIINLAHCMLLHKDPKASISDAYKWAFFTPGDHAKLLVCFLSRYIKAVGREKDDIKELIEMTLAEMSMRELLAYGRHSKMDQIWKELLIYTLDNEGKTLPVLIDKIQIAF